MELPRNQFKQALKRRRHQRGLWCTIPNSGVAELLAGCGFDWLLFDSEHSAMDPLSILPMLQAVAPYPVSAVVRPSSLNVSEIKKLLDFGAQNILVPYVQNAEEAALAAASVAYAPQGIRGVAGATRATRFGSVSGYHNKAREEICLIVQVETQEALDSIEAIAAVPGVDGIFVGPADLAASLGHPGEASHPAVKAVVLDAIARIAAAGLPPGILTLDQNFIPEVISTGAVFVANDVDASILKRGAVGRAAAKY
jgi:4-hydroxy-2-oxoheptanedioate aldolase